MDVVWKIADLPIGSNERPREPILIVDSGEIGDTKHFIRNDPFSKANMEKIKEVNKFSRLFFEDEENYQKKVELMKKKEEPKETEEEKRERLLAQEKTKYEQDNLLEDKELSNLKPEKKKILEGIRARINKNIEKNFDLISKEKSQYINQANANKTKRIQKRKFKLKRKKHKKIDIHNDKMTKEEREKVEEEEEKQNEWMLSQTAYDQQTKKRKKKQMFGWNVFNEDALFDAHKKRMKEMVTEKELIPEELEKLAKVGHVLGVSRGTERELDRKGEEIRKQLVAHNMLSSVTQEEQRKVAEMNARVQHILGDKTNEDEERKERLVKALHKQQKKRESFKRRRGLDPDSKITYINERNRGYNDKLYRYFGSFVRGIESKLERGG
jgi:hypothetical protein